MNSKSFRIYIVLSLQLIGLIAVLFTGGCKFLGFAYKSPVAQGSIIDVKAIEQLEVGMSRDQVKFLLGHPILEDPYTVDRWDYLYLLHPSQGETIRKQFSIHFKGGVLSKMTGDIEKILNAQDTAPADINSEATPETKQEANTENSEEA